MSDVPLIRIGDTIRSVMHKLIFEALTKQVGIEVEKIETWTRHSGKKSRLDKYFGQLKP